MRESVVSPSGVERRGAVRAAAVCLALTAVVAWMTAVATLPSVGQYFVPVSNVRRLGGGLLLCLVVGAVAWRSERAWLALLALLFLLVGAGAFFTAGPCPGGTCGESGLSHLRFAVETGRFGLPNLLVSAEEGACAFDCPYRLGPAPLIPGYAATTAAAASGTGDGAGSERH